MSIEPEFISCSQKNTRFDVFVVSELEFYLCLLSPFLHDIAIVLKVWKYYSYFIFRLLLSLLHLLHENIYLPLYYKCILGKRLLPYILQPRNITILITEFNSLFTYLFWLLIHFFLFYFVFFICPDFLTPFFSFPLSFALIVFISFLFHYTIWFYFLVVIFENLLYILNV